MFFAGKNWHFPRIDPLAASIGGSRCPLPDGSALITAYVKLMSRDESVRIVDDMKAEGWQLVLASVYPQNRDYKLLIFWKKSAS